MDAQSWKAVQKEFFEYLLKQDSLFFRLPKTQFTTHSDSLGQNLELAGLIRA